MSEITNFPMYKNSEDIITNHTLFLFNRLYDYSPEKFQLFLNSIMELEDPVSTEMYFKQQVNTSKSRVDGVIKQNSFKVIIETKRNKNFGIKQIKNHLTGFDNEDKKVILLIGSEAIEKSRIKELKKKVIAEYNKEHDNKINLISTTFEDIIEKFQEVIEKFDKEMQELIEDYEILCEKENIMNKKKTRMRAVPCGDTLEINLKYDLYYMPESRGFRGHKYIGIYNDKTIKAIGEIVKISVVECDVDEGIVDIVEGDELNNQEKDKILEVVKVAYEEVGHEIGSGVRFFLVNKFFDTYYKKETKYPLLGAKYFDVSEIIDGEVPDNTKKLAEQLKNHKW
ncbi:MAG: hypothetical protein ACOCRX_11970 [Candidatus Woesearchaeota archaeon]